MPRLPERPRIPPRFTLIPVDSGEYRFHSFSTSLAVRCGSPNLIARLLPLLDGKRRLSQVLQEMHVFGKEATLDLLQQLNDAGLLEDAAMISSQVLTSDEIERYRDQLTFFSHFTTAAQIAAPAGDYGIPHSALEYQEMLKQARLAVFGLGRLGSSLVQKLALAGVGAIRGVDDGFISAEDVQAGVYRACMLGESRVKALQTLVAEVNPWVEFSPASQAVQTLDEICSLLRGSTFAILSADAFNPGYYELFNQACLAENVPWTSCRLLGFEFLLGPTVIPHQTSCFKCFDLRQKGNLTDYQEYLLLEEYLRSSPLHSGALAITPGIDLAALEVLKALTRFMQPATYSHLYSLNLLSMESKRHPILKLPRCPHCGRSARNHPAIELWQPELIVQESSSPDLAPPVVTQDQIES